MPSSLFITNAIRRVPVLVGAKSKLQPRAITGPRCHWRADAGDGAGAPRVVEVLQLGMLFGIFSEFGHSSSLRPKLVDSSYSAIRVEGYTSILLAST